MKTCFKRVTLNEEISPKNYIGCLVHYFMLSFVFVSVDSLQPLLLQTKFNVNRADQIENFKNALVIGFDILVKLLCAPVFGYLADRLGRKKINLYGIICIAVAMTLMPYAPEYWVYVIIRCFYAQGAIAISVVPLLADYVSHESRGKCAAILVFMSSVGALGSAFINFTILDKIDTATKIYFQYGVVSALILIIGLSYTLICLKSGSEYYSKESKRRNLKELCAVAKTSLQCPEISSGFIAAFLARGDSILLSLYLVLWTYSFDSKKNYEEASQRSSILSGIAYTVIMFSCIVYGFLYERKNKSRRNLMIIMLALAMVGVFMINFATSVDSFMVYGALSVLGLGMSGLLTASIFLVSEFSTKENRGFLTGLQTFFGVVGISMQTAIGAVLYEFVSRDGPFNYFGVTCGVGIILTILVYWHAKKIQSSRLLEASLQTVDGKQIESDMEQGRDEVLA